MDMLKRHFLSPTPTVIYFLHFAVHIQTYITTCTMYDALFRKMKQEKNLEGVGILKYQSTQIYMNVCAGKIPQLGIRGITFF
jgi:hypothetical protein